MSLDLRAVAKAILPRPAHDAWRRFRFELEQRSVRNKPLDEVFTEIYETNAWGKAGDGGKFCSGPGSAPEATAAYETYIADFLERHPEIRRVVDIGCGDFQVAQRILDRCRAGGRSIAYLGCDIASNVVAYNRERHIRPDVTFQVLDITRASPPAADLILIREVLQHLSNVNIAAALANMKHSAPRAVVTEAVPRTPSAPNRDIASGYRTRDGLNSGVYVDQPPFNLQVLDEYSEPVSHAEIFRTTLVTL